MIDEKKLIEIANKFTFTDKTQERQYKDFLKYCVDNAPKVAEWIPCSEMLPEKDGEYLTWIRYDGHEFMSIEDFECSGLLAQWNFEGRNDDEVIAWMPLPEAYKGS